MLWHGASCAARFYDAAGTVGWATALLDTVSDASFAQEACVDGQGDVNMHRSQIGRVNALADLTVLADEFARCHVIPHASLTSTRVYSATMQAERHPVVAAADLRGTIRAIVCDLRGRLGMFSDHGSWC